MSTSGNQNNNADFGVWIAIVVLFAIGLWPISLILLVRQLMGLGKKKGRRTADFHWDAQAAADKVWNTAEGVFNKAEEEIRKQAAASKSSGSAKTASSAGANSTKTKKKTTAKGKKGKLPTGKGLTILGGILSGIFSFTFLTELADAISWGGLQYYVSDLIALLGFLCLGLVLLCCGLAKSRKGKRYRKYLNLIGSRRTVSITALAKTSGAKRRKVLDDLQDMLDDGLLPMGYLDLSRDLLVISEEGIPDEEPAARTEPEPEAPQDDNAILAEIRAVNDAIPDPVMSEKIDRIGEITGKILDYQRQNPGKDSQLRSFLNYYLPTTLKILRSYAQLDAQGVEGENITAAKKRIESMMDKVVEGFENQLDKLFADSAMDISSDVSVLEQMLEKDGLSGGSGMTLGG